MKCDSTDATKIKLVPGLHSSDFSVSRNPTQRQATKIIWVPVVVSLQRTHLCIAWLTGRIASERTPAMMTQPMQRLKGLLVYYFPCTSAKLQQWFLIEWFVMLFTVTFCSWCVFGNEWTDTRMGKNEGFSNLLKKKVHDVWLRDKMDQKQLVFLQPNMFLCLNLHKAFWLYWKTIELLCCLVWLPKK